MNKRQKKKQAKKLSAEASWHNAQKKYYKMKNEIRHLAKNLDIKIERPNVSLKDYGDIDLLKKLNHTNIVIGEDGNLKNLGELPK